MTDRDLARLIQLQSSLLKEFCTTRAQARKVPRGKKYPQVEPGNQKSDKEQAKTDAVRKWGLIERDEQDKSKTGQVESG